MDDGCKMVGQVARRGRRRSGAVHGGVAPTGKRRRGARAMRKRWREAQGMGGGPGGSITTVIVLLQLKRVRSRWQIESQGSRCGLASVGKWSCGCPDDGVVNGIDAAFFFQLSVDPAVLSTIRYTYYISLPVVALFSSLSVSTSFVPTFPSLCPSFFLSFLFVYYWAFPPEPSLV